MSDMKNLTLMTPIKEGSNGNLHNQSQTHDGKDVNCSELAENMRKKMEESTKPSSKCSIYKIPNWIRQNNEKTYEPQMVSIGPIHHGREDLSCMEAFKLMYLEDFLGRTKVSLEDLVKFISEREGRVRKCYAEEINHCSSEKLVEIVLTDAAFVIEILMRFSFTELRQEEDRIFSREGIFRNMWSDFWLLENQLPLFIIEDLFRMNNDIFQASRVHYPLGENRFIIKLAIDFLKFGMTIDVADLGNLYNSPIEHLLDLLRNCYFPLKTPNRTKKNLNTIMPSASELAQHGVKFKQAPTNNLFKMDFEGGVLKIPRLTISFTTTILFRNLLVFEMYHCTDSYINDYLIVMDRLINKPRDVELLAEEEIIDIWVGDSKEVATVINNLGQIVTFYPSSFFFTDVCNRVNKYYCNTWHRTMAILKLQYFTHVWAYVSIGAAVLLLGLTIVQTIFTVRG